MKGAGPAFSPVVVLKLALWLAVAVAATLLLYRRRVSARLRLAFLVGGVLVLGFGFGLASAGRLDPNPVQSLRSLFTIVLRRAPLGVAMPHPSPLPVVLVLLVLLAITLLSNKVFCGWACPLGLLQDLLHHVPLPKWRPSLRLTNSVRIVALGALVAGIAAAGLDWVGLIDPFRLFQLNLTLPIAAFGVLLLAAGLFIYRPWCRFLCPFGLVAWLVEQFSLLRPRVDRKVCKDCRLCVKACPTGAMADFCAEKGFHADCFACGACIEACPKESALGWRARPRN